MSTLKELIEGCELPVKVRVIKWPEGQYVEFFSASERCLIGLTGDGYDWPCYYESYSYLNDNWELYIEPKKKVKVALYAYKYQSEKTYKVTHVMYRDNEHVIEGLGPNCIVKRLDYTEIEVYDE